MQKIAAWLMSVWLGMQLGFVCMLSPILFVGGSVSRQLATQIMSMVLNIANLVGMVMCGFLWLICRPRLDWGRTSHPMRRWIVILLVGLLVSYWLINGVVRAYPHHILLNYVDGGLGAWRGGLHLWNAGLGLMGMMMYLKLWRVDNTGS